MTLPSPLPNVMSRSAAADVEQLRTHIDEDLAELTEAMRVLCSRRDGQAFISRLPYEILVIIFQYFEEDERLNGYGNDDVPACVTVTHVCRHWRKVALECTTLWSFISSASPLWLDVMLERSKDAPLVVTYTIPILLEDCLEKVLSHLPRIKHLELGAFSYDVNRIMDLLSSRPAPMLETFKFFHSGRLLPTVPISDTIFQGQVPLLRDVEVDLCDRRWSSSIFAGLQTLRVKGTSLPDLLSALRCMPTLERLTLVSPKSDETMLCDKVPLARLKSIVLSETSLRTAVPVFAHLALPIDIKITLYLSSIQGPPTFSDLLTVMYKHPGGSGPVLRSLRATNHNSAFFDVRFSTSTVIKNPDDDDIRLSIRFVCDLPVDVQPDIVFDIYQIITQHRRETFFSGELEFIHLEGNPDFIWGLTAALRIGGSSNVTYPSLRVLELRRMVFEDDELRDLRNALTMRARHNVRLCDLRLTLCDNFTVDQVQLFGDVVGNVDCDQYTRDDGWSSRTTAAILIA
ncbi:hypothetical protein EDB19DRAFT_1351729 [Suillus lakei]|nr:hypothetical protein EDB19DRAFT_1351729 [Suillus lakei]